MLPEERNRPRPSGRGGSHVRTVAVALGTQETVTRSLVVERGERLTPCAHRFLGGWHRGVHTLIISAVVADDGRIDTDALIWS